MLINIFIAAMHANFYWNHEMHKTFEEETKFYMRVFTDHSAQTIKHLCVCTCACVLELWNLLLTAS